MSTVPPSTPSFFSSALANIEAPFTAVRDFATPAVNFIATRVQNIWDFIQPYLASAAKFLTSRLGVSLELLGLSIIPLKLAGTVENKILSVALLAAGILIAGAGGLFLASSGALPSFITDVTRIAAV